MEDVNISSVSAVLFQNCESSEYSDISVRFPNMSKLGFLKNNTLPSADFSNFEHLSLFMNVDSELKITPSSSISLSMNAANLKCFYYEGNPRNDIASISLGNATKLENFFLNNTMVSINLKTVSALMNIVENIDTKDSTI